MKTLCNTDSLQASRDAAGGGRGQARQEDVTPPYVQPDLEPTATRRAQGTVQSPAGCVTGSQSPILTGQNVSGRCVLISIDRS